MLREHGDRLVKPIPIHQGRGHKKGIVHSEPGGDAHGDVLIKGREHAIDGGHHALLDHDNIDRNPTFGIELVASFVNLSQLLKLWKKTEIHATRKSAVHGPENVAISAYLFHTLAQSLTHFSPRTALGGCCGLLAKPRRSKSALQKTRNQLTLKHLQIFLYLTVYRHTSSIVGIFARDAFSRRFCDTFHNIARRSFY
jgi:hypothetical protein